jgi:hypothetical protein
MHASPQRPCQQTRDVPGAPPYGTLLKDTGADAPGACAEGSRRALLMEDATPSSNKPFASIAALQR